MWRPSSICDRPRPRKGECALRNAKSPRSCVHTPLLYLAGGLFALGALLALPGLVLQFTGAGQAQLLQEALALGVGGGYLKVNLILYMFIRTAAAASMGILAAAIGRTLLPVLLHPDITPDGAGFSRLAGLCRALPKALPVLLPVLAAGFAVLCIVRGADYIRRNDVFGAFSMLVTEGFLAALLAGFLVWMKRLLTELDDALTLARYALVLDRPDLVGIPDFAGYSVLILSLFGVGLAWLRRADVTGAASYLCAAAADLSFGAWLLCFRRRIAAIALEKTEN